MRRNCAACGSGRKRTIYNQHFVMPSENAFHAGYDVVVCERCGFAFADNTPDQSFLDSYYREMSKKTSMLKRNIGAGYTEPEYIIRQHANSVANIKPHLRPGERVLDVGCYTGNLLKMLRSETGIEDVVGLDPSAFAAKIAKEHHAVDVVVGSVFDDLDLGTFDVVLLGHVLEHIVDLRPFLYRIMTLLGDGGRLYVEVPDAHNFFLTGDADDPIGAEHKDPFLQFSVEHVNYFTRASLSHVMTQNGFHLLTIENQVSTVALLASMWEVQPLPYDADIVPALESYVADSRSLIGKVLNTVQDLVAQKCEILVWGAGLHTQRLLASSALRNARIRAFVDSDPGYHGAQLMGKPIVAPEAVADMPETPILISSQMYEDEIERQIHDSGYRNQVLTLYRSAKVSSA